MAKTIKFNLICDDKPVRTIEDLQNNFSIEDVLQYYNNELLHRWLKVRGYEKELEKVSAITCEKSIDVIKELIKIFDVECDEKKIEESVYILEYLEERKECCAIYKQDNYKLKSIIDDYETGYEQLVKGILENPDDVAVIKANISEIVTNYKWILDLDYRNLFYVLKESSPLAIMCLLMNEHSRNYYLRIKSEREDGTVMYDTDTNTDKADMFNLVCKMVKTKEFRANLGENLHSFSGLTEGYWKDLKTADKKYMIIRMDSGDFVRTSGQLGGDLAYNDILNNFMILDGIDYKSNSATNVLLYMEV